MADTESTQEPAGEPMPPDVVESDDGAAPLLEEDETGQIPHKSPPESGGASA